MLPFFSTISVAASTSYQSQIEVEASWTSQNGGFYWDKVCDHCRLCRNGHASITDILSVGSKMSEDDCRKILKCDQCNPCVECNRRRKSYVIPQTFDKIKHSHVTEKFRVDQYTDSRRVVYGQKDLDEGRYKRFERKTSKLAFSNSWLHFKINEETKLPAFPEVKEDITAVRWCIRYTFMFEFHQVEMTIMLRANQSPIIHFEIEMVREMYHGYSNTYQACPDILKGLTDSTLSVQPYDFYCEVVCIEYFLSKFGRLPLKEEFLLLSSPIGLVYTREQFAGVRDAWLRNSKGKLFTTNMILGKARNLKLDDLFYGGLNCGYAVTHKANGLMAGIFRDRSGYWLFLDENRYWLLSAESNTSNGNHPVIFGEFIPMKRSEQEIVSASLFLAFDEYLQGSHQQYQQRHESLAAHRQILSNVKNAFVFVEKPISIIRFNGWKAVTDAIALLGDKLTVTCEAKEFTVETDGYVFTPVDPMQQKPDGVKIRDLHARVLHSHPDICKWKPHHEITIDLKLVGGAWFASNGKDLKAVEVNVVGKIPTSEGVYELGPHGDSSTQLEVRRARIDKPHPNSLMVVDNNIRDLRDPFTLLPGALINYRYINRMIKRQVFTDTAVADAMKGATVVDFGIGRGGTLPYLRGVKTIIGIEPNEEHLEECKLRHRSSATLIPVTGGAENWQEVLNSLHHELSSTLIITSMLSMSHFNPDCLVQFGRAAKAKVPSLTKVLVAVYAVDGAAVTKFASSRTDTTKESWTITVGSLTLRKNSDGSYQTSLGGTIVGAEDKEHFPCLTTWLNSIHDLRNLEVVSLKSVLMADPLDIEYVSLHKGFVFEL